MSVPPYDQAIAAAIVRARGVQKHYGRVRVLKGVDLTVAPGQVYGFLGRNGAGKSTMIRILAGITRPSGGEVALFGGDTQGPGHARRAKAVATHPGHADVRSRIGYVAQDQNFYGWMTPRSVGRFVRGFYPTWDDQEYARLCQRLELPVDRKLRTFSGGMQVKVALALALAHRPELLILDEPTAGLDPVARREFIAMVRSQARDSGRTTFFSSHWVDEIEAAADTMGILEDGVMRYEGPLSDFSLRVRKFVRPQAESLRPSNPPGALSREVSAPEGAPFDLARAVAEEPGVQLLQRRHQEGMEEVVLWFDAGRGYGPLPRALHQQGYRERTLSLEDGFIELVTRSDLVG